MKIELNKFEAKCISLLLFGVRPEIILEIVKSENSEINQSDINCVFTRVGNKLRSELEN